MTLSQPGVADFGCKGQTSRTRNWAGVGSASWIPV